MIATAVVYKSSKTRCKKYAKIVGEPYKNNQSE